MDLIKYKLRLVLTLSGFIALSLFFATSAYCESSSDGDLSNLSLEDLLKVKIQGAAQEKKGANSTPAAVTVITSDEIQRSGARDLRDVLNLVPGVSFAADTQGVIGIAIRGIWAHEGKVLLIIDGEEMNDLAYSITQFGHHYPADSIARVEVIRGPGSATHGGYGELAVINVITKGAEDYSGMVASGVIGQSGAAPSERVLGLGFAGKSDGWKLSSYLSGGEGSQSDRGYTDQTGSTYSFAGRSHQDALFINLGASTERLNLRFIFDRYQMTDQTAYGQNASMPLDIRFQSLNFGVSYRESLSEKLTLTPELHIKQQTPWQETQPEAHAIPQLYYNVTTESVQAKVTARQEITTELNAHLGLEGSSVRAYDAYPGGSVGQNFPNGLQSVEYFKKAIFTEVNWDPEIAHFTLGGRYESQNVGGAALVPRFAAIKEFGSFHVKGLYSWGFREPGVENLRFSPSLTSETSKVGEVEVGYHFSPNLFTTLNLFTLKIENPIIYGFANGTQNYVNSSTVGTYGLEWDTRYKSGWGMLDLNYSYSHPSDIPTDYQIPGRSDTMLGIANNKVALLASGRLVDDQTRATLSETYFSARYGYDYDPSGASGLNVRRFHEAFLTNLMIERSDVFFRGFDVGFGVFNLLNQDFRYIQPYDGGHPPIPGQSRDWIIKLGYRTHL